MSEVTRTRDRTRNDGSGIVEVMIAALVLAFGLLALAAMQIAAIQNGSTGRYTTHAVAIGSDQLEQLQGVPWATVAAASGAGWQAPAWINAAGLPQGDIPVTVNRPGSATSVVQVYSVAWRVTPVVGNTNLLNLDVEVSWIDPKNNNNRPTRTGRPTVAMSSVRYNW